MLDDREVPGTVTGGTRTSSGSGRQRSRPQGRDRGAAEAAAAKDLVDVLADTVRGVEQAARYGRVRPQTQVAFQVVAMLLRQERARIGAAEAGLTRAGRADALERVEAIGTAMARAAARDASLLSLLNEGTPLLPGARGLVRELYEAAGQEPPEQLPGPAAGLRGPTDASPFAAPVASERQVVPVSAARRQLASPFLEPDYAAAAARAAKPRRLAGWELLAPLLRAFEVASPGAPSCMELPEPLPWRDPTGGQLMLHQAQLVEAAADGHRTFLLADEPGLGKTAQALLAAQVALTYPLLVVVPSVVKANWARESARWTPSRSVSVVHGDGEAVDAFADIIIVNYDVLDRHAGWLSGVGLQGMVLDEAHFIKNKGSLRSRAVLGLAEQVRAKSAQPLLMALTGTPLVNDIEDFLAVWQFLGWVDDEEPRGALLEALEESGLTPGDPGFLAVARAAVIAQGIVRRRKVDVAKDIPARRVADLVVELDGAEGRSVREAERALVRRLLRRYDAGLAARAEEGTEAAADADPSAVDVELVRRVASGALREGEKGQGENVFSALRRIGAAKAGPAADYTVQLARSAGKVVFFAKHIEVLDAAEKAFTDAGVGFRSVRGDQRPTARQQAVDDFTNDPSVQVAVCSLLAAGVGLNLQVASDLVLSELSWTDAEQTQAIDRVHRIGQDRPVTAWRVVAAQTLDARVAELLSAKAGLSGRALDGEDTPEGEAVDVRLEALVGLLTDAVTARAAGEQV